MEKVLFITQLLPFPPHSGGKFKTFHILHLLRQKYHIHVFCFYDKKSEKKHIKELERTLDIKVHAVYQPLVTTQHMSVKVKYLRSLLSPQPFSVYKYSSTKLRQLIITELQKNLYAFAYCDHETSFQFLSANSTDLPIIYDEHNIHSLNYWRQAKQHLNPLYKGAYLWETIKHYWWEKRLFDAVAVIFAISTVDAKRIKQRTNTPVEVLPLPLTTKKLFRFSKKKRMLFVGMLSWPANKQGLLWFIKEVFPIVRKLIPNIELDIIGPNADQEIMTAANSSHIHLHGEVASLDRYYQQANVVIAPILTGSGVRIKILHALATGVPVVSTRLGSEGIATEKSGIMVADTPPRFAQAINTLCTNATLAKQASKQALIFIKQQYSVEIATAKLEAAVQKL